MALTNQKILTAKPKEKGYKIPDTGGLYIWVTPKGTKSWRFDYKFANRYKTITFGKYPETPLVSTLNTKVGTLVGAREMLSEAKLMIKQGVDPMEERKRGKVAQIFNQDNSLKSVFENWKEHIRGQFKVSTFNNKVRRIEIHILKNLGTHPISSITPQDIINCMEEVKVKSGVDTTIRTQNTLKEVYKYAIIKGLTQTNPCNELQGYFVRDKAKHHPAILNPKRLGEVLTAVKYSNSHPIVKNGLLILAHVFVRPSDVTTMRWADLDFEKNEWRFFTNKENKPHIVPLSSQVRELIEEVRVFNSESELVFCGFKSKKRPISSSTFRSCLASVGVSNLEHVPHGFRSTARTLLEEELSCKSSRIELQMSHVQKGPLGETYNRTQFLEDRTNMMQQWSNYLESLMLL